MAKRFHFRLEKVLAYRKQREEQAQMALAEALARYRDQNRRMAMLKEEFTAAQDELAYKKSISQNDFWLWGNYKAGMMKRIEDAQLLLRQIGQEVVRCRENVIQRSKEHKILEKLKENQASLYEHKQKQLEQKELDEITQLRRTREFV